MAAEESEALASLILSSHGALALPSRDKRTVQIKVKYCQGQKVPN